MGVVLGGACLGEDTLTMMTDISDPPQI